MLNIYYWNIFFSIFVQDFLLNFPESFEDDFWSDNTAVESFFIVATNLVLLFDSTIQCLLLIIIMWTTSFVKIFNQRLADEVCVASNDANSTNFPQCFHARLEEWKRKHSLICQLLDKINKLFGLVTFLFLYYRFVSVITYAFMVWPAVRDSILEQKEFDLEYASLTCFISETFKLITVIYISHILQLEVIKKTMRIHHVFLFFNVLCKFIGNSFN